MRTIRWFEVGIVLVGALVLLWAVRSSQDDTEGSIKPSPSTAAPASTPEPFEPGPWTFEEVWSLPLEHAHGLAAGDVDSDGTSEVLVARHASVEILSLEGKSKGALQLEADITQLEMGRGKTGPVLLGYKNWGDEITTFSVAGKVLWTRPTPNGANGAHWGDLDSDGVDEVIIGMNVSGGLLAVDSDGQELWSFPDIGNVWSQAVIPASSDQPARVFATHAMGTILEFDSEGQVQGELTDLGYVAPMNAARMKPSGDVQLVIQADVRRLLFSSKVVLGVDEKGEEIWRISVEDGSNWRATSFAHGDLNRDGTEEWVVPDRQNRLAVMSHAGERLGTIELPSGFATLAITSEGLLVVSLEDKLVAAYSIAND